MNCYGILSLASLESAVAQPRAMFGGKELYPTLIEKASALGFSLIMNHAFIDGNKRIGHQAMETFLIFNGYEIKATINKQESIISTSRKHKTRLMLNDFSRAP